MNKKPAEILKMATAILVLVALKLSDPFQALAKTANTVPEALVHHHDIPAYLYYFCRTSDYVSGGSLCLM